MKLKILVICLIVISSIPLYSLEPLAETATLSGLVKDNSSKEALIGATVVFQKTGYGAYTNRNGFFSITGITPGKYTVRVSYLGYEVKEVEINLEATEPVRRDFLLEVQDVITDEVTVIADRDIDTRQITVSKVNIPVEQIKAIKIGGESDVFRTLQFLPGVLTSSQISSGLYVRGGSPDQNLVLLDGAVVYNPTHLFGFISTFNTDAIKDVELIKGGYPAEYGGRLSAVLNITQKDGNQDHIEGLVSVGAISSKVSIQGPMPWEGASWFISGRRTYFELIKEFIPDDPDNPLPNFNFYDLNAKITQNIGDNDKISLSGFLSEDALSYDSYGLDMGLDVGNKMSALNWTHVFNEGLFLETILYGSYYFNTFLGDQSGYEFKVDNNITDITFKSSLEWFTNERITHKFGIEASNLNFKYLADFSGNIDSTEEGTSAITPVFDIYETIYSAFAQVNYRILKPLSLQAGLRASYWKLSDEVVFDPRMAIRYQLTDDVALKASWGIFHQSLKLAAQPDFSFFDTWLPTDSSIAISRSDHFIFAVETYPIEGYILNFDFYYKNLYNINELDRLGIARDSIANVNDVFFTGNGRAYGAEIFLQRRFGKLTGWFGYTLGWIEAQYDDINSGKTFRPKYDRRHDIKIIAQYEINKRWDVGGSYTFQSGQSYTGALSRYQTTIGGEVGEGRGKFVPSQRYGLRLPPSHQLNLNASYSTYLFNLPVKFILDIYNVYNRRDIWFRYYNLRDPEAEVLDVRLLPILPTVSIEVKF